jgi:hypothetical protein
MIIPSNAARSGGIVFPVAKSLAEAYESRPGETAGRLGAFLIPLVYQCDVIVCAMFLTGQASNVLIAKFARDVTGIDLSYSQWALAALVPGVVSLIAVPLIFYRIFPPEIKHTPAAAELAATELSRMGKMQWGERMMLIVFALVAGLWMTTLFHGINYAVVALVGICVLLVTGVLSWEDVISERAAWDVFIWYGGLVRMAEALGETGITKRFAEASAGFTSLWLREHYRARHGHVYSVSHSHPGCRRPSISSSSFIGIFFESRRIAYPLWDNTRTYLFCSWVRYAAQVVVDGIARFLNQYSYLGNLRIRLVEVAETLVAGIRDIEAGPR